MSSTTRSKAGLKGLKGYLIAIAGLALGAVVSGCGVTPSPVVATTTPRVVAAHTPAPRIGGDWRLVSFGAEWCPECHRLAPELAFFAPEQPNVKVTKVDVDQRDSEPFQTYFKGYFKGRAIPFTVLLDPSGKARREWVGYIPYNTMVGDILALAPQNDKAE